MNALLQLVSRARVGTRVLVANLFAVATVLGGGVATWYGLRSVSGMARLALDFLVASFAAAAGLTVVGILVARSVVRQTRALAEESRALTEAVAEGRVDVRCDASVAGPEFQPIMDAMNQALDAFVAPILTTGKSRPARTARDHRRRLAQPAAAVAPTIRSGLTRARTSAGANSATLQSASASAMAPAE